jgi:CheY-like chemotaxis protein
MDKILIIDDEQAVLQVLTQSLENLPFEIITAENGETGLQLFAEHNPFLVILDMNMGEVSGLDFINYLLEHELPHRKTNRSFTENQKSEGQQSPTLKDADFFVLVLTGYGNKELMHKCASLGVEYFLNKPVHLATLRSVVEAIHRLKSNRDDLIRMASYNPVI